MVEVSSQAIKWSFIYNNVGYNTDCLVHTRRNRMEPQKGNTDILLSLLCQWCFTLTCHCSIGWKLSLQQAMWWIYFHLQRLTTVVHLRSSTKRNQIMTFWECLVLHATPASGLSQPTNLSQDPSNVCFSVTAKTIKDNGACTHLLEKYTYQDM